MDRLRMAVIGLLMAVAFVTSLAVAGAMKAPGEVVKTDPAARSLVVKVEGKDITFAVSDKAAKALGDLKPGDKVMVSYEESGGKRTADAIEKTVQ